jgi:sugar phosphate isomerase/epimerase
LELSTVLPFFLLKIPYCFTYETNKPLKNFDVIERNILTNVKPYIFNKGIKEFFLCTDWIVPTPDLFKGRGMMGDGVIELRKIRNAVEQSGYKGPIEVEIINEEMWNMAGDKSLSLIKERYLSDV